MKERLRHVSEKLSLYLPVLLMGVLALGTWWLVRNAPKPLAITAERAVVHEPDYYMKDFSIKKYDLSGRLTSHLQGTQAHHYPDTDTMEIDNPRMILVAPDGRITRGTANRALSNGDGSEVQLFGNAVVTRDAFTPPGKQTLPVMKFEGEFLHAWPNEERVESNKPVILTRGTDRFTGDSLNYNNLDQVLKLNGRVRGVIQGAAAQRQ